MYYYNFFCWVQGRLITISTLCWKRKTTWNYFFVCVSVFCSLIIVIFTSSMSLLLITFFPFLLSHVLFLWWVSAKQTFSLTAETATTTLGVFVWVSACVSRSFVWLQMDTANYTVSNVAVCGNTQQESLHACDLFKYPLRTTCMSTAEPVDLWPKQRLQWGGDKRGSKICFCNGFDYSAFWLCVRGEGKSRHIQRG